MTRNGSATLFEPVTHEKSAQRRYFDFLWPLALVGLSMHVARQFQNRTLASYEDAKRELAVFAIAFSTHALFGAMMVFIPQMTNRLARSRGSYRRCLKFTVLVSCIITLLVGILSLTPPGEWLLRRVYTIDDAALHKVIRYLRFFLPLSLMRGFGAFYRGLLTQIARTGLVTVLQVTRLVVVAVILFTGWERGWDPVLTLAMSQLAPGLVQLALAYIFVKRVYTLPPEKERVGWKEIFDFFWPIAITGVMFATSRPILFAFLSRVENSEAMIASVAVAFTLAMMFHMPVNACRDVFVTFGREDLKGTRNFALKVTAMGFFGVLLFTATPLARLALVHFLNVKPDILDMAADTFWPLTAIPLIVMLRNYYHGRALIERRTVGMGVGGISRNVAVAGLGATLYALGWLNHITTAALLSTGFLAEALAVMIVVRMKKPGDGTGSVAATPSQDR
jgi:Na+-driven multidrug efflux pump